MSAGHPHRVLLEALHQGPRRAVLTREEHLAPLSQGPRPHEPVILDGGPHRHSRGGAVVRGVEAPWGGEISDLGDPLGSLEESANPWTVFHGSASGMPLGRSLLFSLRPRALRPLLALAELGLAAACSSSGCRLEPRWADGRGNHCDTWCPYGTPGSGGRGPDPGARRATRKPWGPLVARPRGGWSSPHEPHARGRAEAVRVLARYAGACPGRLARRAALGLVPPPCGSRSRDRGVLLRNRLLQQPSRARSSDSGAWAEARTADALAARACASTWARPPPGRLRNAPQEQWEAPL